MILLSYGSGTGGTFGGSPVTVSDDFDRANSTGIGANWTEALDQFDIVSNNAVQPTASTTTLAFWNGGETFGANQYVEIVINGPITGYFGCVIRGTDSSKRVYSLSANGSHRIFEIGSGTTGGQIGSSSAASLVIGDTLRIESSGATVTLKRNASTLTSATMSDANLTGRLIGILVSDNAAVGNIGIRSFAGGEL